MKKRIILASSSPRRKELLKGLLNNFGLKFVVIPANIAEYIPKKIGNFKQFVIDLAYKKAELVARKNDGIVIAADTIVVLNGEVLGKPKNKSEANVMLRKLSSKEHKVYTGLVIISSNVFPDYQSCEVTKVKFRKLTDNEIKFYVATNSPLDKAGAYGIQDDLGSTFVERISGDYFNVVGLPVMKTYLGLNRILRMVA
ncbi:MAG: Maf family protein [Chlorobi bacterium]|nr:Maf family protein [Chlorobiota bacterium]MCI0716183.1 Maf family protein [Chlorobiota bacterium]